MKNAFLYNTWVTIEVQSTFGCLRLDDSVKKDKGGHNRFNGGAI